MLWRRTRCGDKGPGGAASAGVDVFRLWAAALLVFGILAYAGLRLLPPSAPAQPRWSPVRVGRVVEVSVRPAPLVNINEASVAELQELPGIGPVLARRIVEHRETRGHFASVDQLSQVSGVGRTTIEGLKGRAGVD